MRAIRPTHADARMWGTFLGNLLPVSTYLAFVWVTDITNAVAWGLALIAVLMLTLGTSIAAEISNAIRSRRP